MTKYIAIVWLAILAGCMPSLQETGVKLAWQNNLPEARSQAQAENKVLLLNFTGSDWCPWCVKLSKEIFNTPEFAAFAETNLVLVELDFPRRKSISREQEQANRDLAKRFDIQGFPTVVLLDGQDRELGRLGYQRGGPKAFIAAVEKLRARDR